VGSEQTAPSRIKILLVDDDDLVRTAIEDVLSDAGFEVVATADPHEALGLSGAISPPRVVITDIDLSSVLNGFDVAAGAHLRWPTAEVILISGLPVNHTGRVLGPRDHYLQKPFSCIHLLEAIERAVDDARREQL
jgi:two-component system, NtrC family, C4-dicarboxylate transport response regulator DctD